MDDTRYTVGAAGVVLNANGQVLLIKTAQFGWELPGGRMERGEDLIAALKREILEESGCHATVDRLVGVSTNTTGAGLLVFTFTCRHSAGEPQPGDDSLDAGWFAPDEAVHMVTHPAERARLQDGLAPAPTIMYRVYRGQGMAVVQETCCEL